MLPPPASISDITSHAKREVLMPLFDSYKAIQPDEAQCEADEISDMCFENAGTLDDALFEGRPEGHFELANSYDSHEVPLQDIKDNDHKG